MNLNSVRIWMASSFGDGLCKAENGTELLWLLFNFLQTDFRYAFSIHIFIVFFSNLLIRVIAFCYRSKKLPWRAAQPASSITSTTTSSAMNRTLEYRGAGGWKNVAFRTGWRQLLLIIQLLIFVCFALYFRFWFSSAACFLLGAWHWDNGINFSMDFLPSWR